jgi:hypothetical protein
MHMPFWYVAFISYLFQQFLNLFGLLLSKHDISISRLSDFFCRSSKIHLTSASYIPVKHQAYLYEVAIGSRLQPPHNVIENIVVSVSSKQFLAVLPKNLLAKIFHFIHKNLRWCQYSFKWEKLKFFVRNIKLHLSFWSDMLLFSPCSRSGCWDIRFIGARSERVCHFLAYSLVETCISKIRSHWIAHYENPFLADSEIYILIFQILMHASVNSCSVWSIFLLFVVQFLKLWWIVIGCWDLQLCCS